MVSDCAVGGTDAALSESVKVDVAIVGAGYTGLSTALHLAERGVSVCVLEANEPGWGASGRNGGQVNPTLKYDPEQLVRMYGSERAEPLISTVSNSADLVFNLIERHGIDCAPVRKGWMQLSYTDKGVAGLHARADQWARRGVPVQRLDATAVASRLGGQAFAGGWLDGRAGAIQPVGVRPWAGERSTGSRRAGSWPQCGDRSTAPGYRLAIAHGWRRAGDRRSSGAGDQWLQRQPVAGHGPEHPRGEQFHRRHQATERARGGQHFAGETVSTAQRLLLYFRKDNHGRLLADAAYSMIPHRPPISRTWNVPWRCCFRSWGRWRSNIAGPGVSRSPVTSCPTARTGTGADPELGCNGRGIALCTSLGQQLAGRV
jgi:hypothetical protein